MKIINKNWNVIILLISIVAVGSAHFVENVFGILPCKMCLYQRYPYYFIIFISLIFLFFKKFSQTFYKWLLELSFIVGLFFSVWHVGIEQKILPGFSSCTSVLNKSESLNDLKNQILNQNIITCDEITWSIFGLSAATINSLLLLILLLINTIFLLGNQNGKEKVN